MRFGLIGTGPWAQSTHGPALASTPGVELVGLWGRSPERTTALAETLGTAAYDDVAALVEDVDAIAFAVPPDVQAELAVTVAEAGRHLLLEKPVATTVDQARAVRDAAAAAGVASVVFFTDRFVPAMREWIAQAAATGGWGGGWLRWFGALQTRGSSVWSPWRWDQGALWDIGPHAVSTLSAALGPITRVTATGGEADLVVLTFSHASGATSTATLTVFAPPAAAGVEAVLWGESGLLPMPPRPGGVADALRTAAVELVEAAETGVRHPLDVTFGVHVVELLADAARQLRR